MTRIALLASFLLSSLVATAENHAKKPDVPPQAYLRSGEILELKMSWGILSNTGTTRIETTEETFENLGQYRIKITTKSRGIVDTFYPVTNDSETLIDATTGRPLAIKIEGKSGKRLSRSMTVYDYLKGEVVHTDYIRPSRNGTAKLPEEPAYDLMVAMLKTRAWRLQPGESRNVLCSNEDDFYSITVTALRTEKIKTPVGEFDTVVVEPKQNGELKGFFKKGGGLKAWISQGDSPQIVRLEFKTKSATIIANLSKVVSPSTPIAEAEKADKLLAQPQPPGKL